MRVRIGWRLGTRWGEKKLQIKDEGLFNTKRKIALRRLKIALALSKFSEKTMITQNHMQIKVTKNIHLSGANQDKISLVAGADKATPDVTSQCKFSCGKAQCSLTPWILASSLTEYNIKI